MKEETPSFDELIRAFYEAVAAMTDEEVAAIKEFNQKFQKDKMELKGLRTKRFELLRVLAAIKNLKIPNERRRLQEQIEKLNAV